MLCRLRRGHCRHLVNPRAEHGQFAIHVTHCVNAINEPSLRYVINIIGEFELAQLAYDILNLYID